MVRRDGADLRRRGHRGDTPSTSCAGSLAATAPPRAPATSTKGGGWSATSTETSDDILDVADLAALPRGRAILIGSGTRPVLIAPRAWHQTRWAEQVGASIAVHDPAPANKAPAPVQGATCEPDVTLPRDVFDRRDRR